MLLWVGLGNPEPGMACNRHNVGFMALDVIVARHRFSDWRRRFRGLIAEGSITGERILALKPLTYMNLSGEAVRAAAAFYKIPTDAITVFQDELDLEPGRVRVKKGGGNAGHNGLRSIDKALDSRDYWRVRIGIGHPDSRERVLGYVLGNFSRAECEEWLTPTLAAVADGAALLVTGHTEEFMSKVALAAKPTKITP